MTDSSSSRPSSPRGRHRAAVSTLRRAAVVVLTAGAALALAAAFGPVWFVRAGVLIAVAVAVVVLRLGWAEARRIDDEFAARTVRSSADHRSALDREQRRLVTERSRAAARVEEVEQRNHGLEHAVAALREELVTATHQSASLRHELSVRTEELAAVRAELEVERGGSPSVESGLADVHQLPRHGTAEADRDQQSRDQTPGASTVVGLPGVDPGRIDPGVDPGWDNLEVDVAVAHG